MGSTNDGVLFANVNVGLDKITKVKTVVALMTDGVDKKANKADYLKKDESTVTCHPCQQNGHYVKTCDKAQVEQQTKEQVLMAGMERGEFDAHNGYLFQHQEPDITEKIKAGGQVPQAWILLDNQSTAKVFHTSDVLKNIRPSMGYMDIHCKAAGVTSTNMIGDLPGCGKVWRYHPNRIANILSLKQVKNQGHHVI
jgi:hypothetical protein